MIRCCFFLLCTIFILSGCREKAQIRVKEHSKIVFLSNRDRQNDKFDIFMMKPDGSEQTNLTPHLQSVNTLSHPVLSPDGKSILFLSFDKKTRLNLLNINSRELLTLTDINYTGNIQHSFSPDGDKIVAILRIGRFRQIHIINRDGSGKQNISHNDFDEYDPCFSSDGSKIIYVSRRIGEYVIAEMNPDGSKKNDRFRQKKRISFPSISPDEEYITFISYDNKIPGLFIINTDGSGLVNLTKNKVVEAKPKFTPDASKIVFITSQRGIKYRDVAIINIDGDQFKNLTPELNSINQLPQITSDGKSVIFQSFRLDNSDIYSVDIDGGNLKNLTNHPKWDQIPSI